MSPDRAVELRIAAHLGAALQALVCTDRTLTNDEVIAGSAEFLTQVCVLAHVAEREQGYVTPLEEIAQRLDDLTGAIALSTMRRLQRIFPPNPKR